MTRSTTSGTDIGGAVFHNKQQEQTQEIDAKGYESELYVSLARVSARETLMMSNA